jgi:hypothetical protein
MRYRAISDMDKAYDGPLIGLLGATYTHCHSCAHSHRTLLEKGLEQSEVEMVIKDNPAELLGLDARPRELESVALSSGPVDRDSGASVGVEASAED